LRGDFSGQVTHTYATDEYTEYSFEAYVEMTFSDVFTDPLGLELGGTAFDVEGDWTETMYGEFTIYND